MEKKQISLKMLGSRYAIGRLAANEAVPSWADGTGFVSISRTEEELSIVCPEERMPQGVRCDRDWVCFQFLGPFAFDQTGIALSVIRPLSEGDVGIFLISTFDTDYLLIKRPLLERAKRLLQEAGHMLIQGPGQVVRPIQ
jgi:uncharacterized protein